MPKEELISALREKVHQSQGNVGLCWRNFSFPGDIPSRPIKVLHYMAGQICGELMESDSQKIRRLNLGYVGGPRSDNSKEYHSFSVDYAIPSKGIFEKKANGRLFLASHDEWERLLDKDDISFSLEELDNTFKNSLFQINRTPLTDFGLCFGENEIRELCEEKGLEFDEEGFGFLVDSGKRKGFIEGYYTGERKRLGENLVKAVSKLKYTETRLRNIEGKILSSTCWLMREKDGSQLEWSDSESVGRYWDLRGNAKKSFSEVESLLTSAKEKELGKLGKISGEIIGCPGTIDVDTYLNYASTLNDSAGKLVNRMNKHLAAEKEKVYPS